MDLALIQQDVKACNFWEFLEIELLLVSSYSYAWRRHTCLGSFGALPLAATATACTTTGLQFHAGKKKERSS